MRAFAIVLLSLGVIGGYGSALGHLRHHGSCGAGYDRGGHWVPGHWESDVEERAVAPATPAPAPAPAPVVTPTVIPPPQIILVQPQQAPAAPPTIIVQPPAQAAPAAAPAPAPAVKTEPAKAPASE